MRVFYTRFFLKNEATTNQQFHISMNTECRSRSLKEPEVIVYRQLYEYEPTFNFFKVGTYIRFMKENCTDAEKRDTHVPLYPIFTSVNFQYCRFLYLKLLSNVQDTKVAVLQLHILFK